ncbi:acetate--CoA ligase family protein [uncultured Sphingomonas sp.]|uniref:acetate--CoA ligase family protein n=1 Tax=uncultured Sphingomonas sp. TaxID=158754 RepID=UPI0025CE19AC|nr:acetate--CoA ligase family protein [uncultured Sphingomonas sp.]
MDLARLLTPRSVAIVGASEKPGALGAAVLANLVRHGFAGDIHLINPKRDTIEGRPCLAGIDQLPEGVDTAILAIPGPAVLDAIRALAARGVGAAIIFSAGFAEGGAEGLAAQAEVARIARQHGMVVEGPNCLGLTNYVAGVPLTFVEMPPIETRDRPCVGIVSQSGAMAAVLGTVLTGKQLGISAWISTGNEAASGVEDYVAWMIDEPNTRVIAMIVEQFRKPARFLELAARARAAGKPIVLLHPGTSSAARESAATHTGAMAGDWALMKTKVTRAGVVVVENLEELGDVAEILARTPPLQQGGVAVLGESGAFKALTLDLAERIGLPLPPIGGKTHDAIRATLPDFIGVSNPMDLTAQALVDPDLYRRTLAPLLADPAYAAVVLGIIQTDAGTCARKFPPITEAVRALAPTKPLIFAGLDEGAPVPPEMIAALHAEKVPYFPTADRACRALARLLDAERHQAAKAIAPVTLELPSGVVPEYLAKQALAPLGISFPAGGFAQTPDEAVAIAERVGYPVALKAQAAALSHKSDAGGVLLNIADEPALRAAWRKLYANVAAYDAGLALDGALVEAMGARGVELIVGARNDPDWGPVILVGLGGVTAELMRDVCLLPPDLTRDSIVAALRRLKGAALFDGYRGSPAVDLNAVAEIVQTLGRLLAGTPAIREIDLNPVIARPDGAVALDALILTA